MTSSNLQQLKQQWQQKISSHSTKEGWADLGGELLQLVRNSPHLHLNTVLLEYSIQDGTVTKTQLQNAIHQLRELSEKEKAYRDALEANVQQLKQEERFFASSKELERGIIQQKAKGNGWQEWLLSTHVNLLNLQSFQSSYPIWQEVTGEELTQMLAFVEEQLKLMPPVVEKNIRISYIHAQPKGQTEITSYTERTKIKSVIKYPLLLLHVDKASLQDISNHIERNLPFAIHIAAHGSTAITAINMNTGKETPYPSDEDHYELLLHVSDPSRKENADGVTATRLIEYLNTIPIEEMPPLWVFCSCHSAALVEQLAPVIRYLVYVDHKLENRAAEAFSENFYRYLYNQRKDIATPKEKQTIESAVRKGAAMAKEFLTNQADFGLYIDGQRAYNGREVFDEWGE